MAARISSTIRSQYRQVVRTGFSPRRRHPPLSYLLHPQHTLSPAYAFLEFRVGEVHDAGGINIAAGPVPQETIAPPRRRPIGRRNRGDRGRPRTSPPWGVLRAPATPRS